jgi:hypothetical protein
MTQTQRVGSIDGAPAIGPSSPKVVRRATRTSSSGAVLGDGWARAIDTAVSSEMGVGSGVVEAVGTGVRARR